MSASQRQHHSRLKGASRLVGLVAALLVWTSLVACTAAGPPTAAPTAQTESTPLPLDGDLDAGTYVVTGFTVPFEVTVPAGWRIHDGWRLIREAPAMEVFVTFLNPAYVPADACVWSPPIPKVEATVKGFVDALVDQTSTTTTAPTEIMVGDYAGLEFDYAVESGVGDSGCRSGHVCVYAEEPKSCARWYISVAERETYRVVDLGGERAVISVGQYREEVDPALIEEARAVFDSIVFKSRE
jgi:hypothetical protein